MSVFVARVHERVRRAVSQPRFVASQRELLVATVERAMRPSSGALSNPLSLMYLLARAHGRVHDELAARVGAYGLMYILALDLFDDVQDEDLVGTAHEEAGAPIAINSAIALLLLANDELREALSFATDAQQEALLSAATEAGLSAVAGQHLDLLGTACATVTTPADVLSMQQGKTSSVILIAECAALLAGAAPATLSCYRRVGECLAQIVQVTDDLRDVFGKEVSPDLATGKLTYPIACFLEGASHAQRQRLETLRAGLPETMPHVRALLYDGGAVSGSAAAIERCRREIHAELAAQDVASPAYHRLVLEVVDEVAGAIYPVPEVEASAVLTQPTQGSLARRVADELDKLRARLGPLGLPRDLPALRPWHQAHWMYMPSKHTIFFPDLDALGDEILPFQAELLGSRSLDEPRMLLTQQVPLVLAHELFHFWRDATGRLTRDHWHEEWAANSLSVAYAAEYEPAALQTAVSLACRVTGRFPKALGPEVDRLLVDCQRERPDANGYGLGPLGTAVVALEMVRRLALENVRPLRTHVAELLGAPSRVARLVERTA